MSMSTSISKVDSGSAGSGGSAEIEVRWGQWERC